MKTDEAIRTLCNIQAKYGVLEIVGGVLSDDTVLAHVMVVDDEGREIWPNDPNGVEGKAPIAGVFLTS